MVILEFLTVLSLKHKNFNYQNDRQDIPVNDKK